MGITSINAGTGAQVVIELILLAGQVTPFSLEALNTVADHGTGLAVGHITTLACGITVGNEPFGADQLTSVVKSPSVVLSALNNALATLRHVKHVLPSITFDAVSKSVPASTALCRAFSASIDEVVKHAVSAFIAMQGALITVVNALQARSALSGAHHSIDDLNELSSLTEAASDDTVSPDLRH